MADDKPVYVKLFTNTPKVAGPAVEFSTPCTYTIGGDDAEEVKLKSLDVERGGCVGIGPQTDSPFNKAEVLAELARIADDDDIGNDEE